MTKATTKQAMQKVHDWTNGKIVYDISVAHPDGQGNPTPYADLTAALGNGGANIPEPLRKGGMSVKFIKGSAQSSDKYVQYFLSKNNWSTSKDDWQKMNLKEEVSQLGQEVDDKIYLPTYNEEDDKYITNAGTIYNAEGYAVTDYRELNGDSIVIQNVYATSAACGCVYYDAEKDYLGYYSTQVIGVQTFSIASSEIPQGAKYIRSTYKKDSPIHYKSGVLSFIEKNNENTKILAQQFSQLGQQILHNFIKGNGNAYSNIEIHGLVPNKTYLLVINLQSLKHETVTSTAYKFAVQNHYDNADTVLFGETSYDNIKESYFLTIPNNSDFIKVGGRFDKNNKTWFDIIDISFIENYYLGSVASRFKVEKGKAISANNGIKTEISNSNLSYIDLSRYVADFSIVKLSNFDYTPSIAAAATYTRILYFNAQDELLSQLAVATDGIMELRKPSGATQCYVDLPTAKIDIVKLRLCDYIGADELSESTSTQIVNDADNDMVTRNRSRIPMLINSCRLHKTSNTSKDFMAVICTDMHNDRIANQNAISATNGISCIDAYINAGDIMSSYYDEVQVANFAEDFSKLKKRSYVVCGNHDVGNAYYIGVTCTHEQAYNAFIKPMIDKGWLTNSEYEVGKPYWYHDDTSRKIRFIGLYEYDNPLDFNETYWRAVTYDSTLDDIAYSTSYTAGDKVNIPNYTAYSFEAVQAVTTPANYYTTPEKLPSYKTLRGNRLIRETQANWFLDILATTPANYGVIVIMHNPFSLNAESIEAKFSYPSGLTGSSKSQNYMSDDFVRNAIVAFVNKSADYSEDIIMTSKAGYLNVEGYYYYHVSKDFSSVASGAYLLGIIGGHAHLDLIWKDATENIYQVSPNCAATDRSNNAIGDVRKTTENGLCHDNLTVVSLANDRIGLVKLGVNVTERGTMRDYEVIDTTLT